MPVAKGGRYRVKETSGGKKVRLHFDKSGQVDEALNLETKAKHTAAEFAEDRKKKRAKKGR